MNENKTRTSAGQLLLLAAIIVAGLVAALVLLKPDAASGSGSKEDISHVVFNEVMTSNKGAVIDPSGQYSDWIELLNTEDVEVDISGLGLGDDVKSGAKFVFPSGTVIKPHGCIVVWCSGEDRGGLFAPFKLSATDSLVLFNSEGGIASSMGLTAVASGSVLSRNEDGTWVESSSPSPGYPNTEYGIEAYRESRAQTEVKGLYINEFMASNVLTVTDGNGEYSDYIELYNANTYNIDLSGFGLSDSLGEPMKCILPKGTVVQANGYLLIFCSNGSESEGEVCVSFSLSSSGEDVVLSAPDGSIVDSVSYTEQESDKSMAREPDGSGDFAVSSSPTPGYPNTSAGAAAFAASMETVVKDLYISEIIGSNCTAFAGPAGDYPDAIELHNRGNSTVNLSGYALSDDAKNPIKWVFGDVSIEAGQYLVVYATGNDVREGNTLEASFSVSSDGETILLFDPDKKVVDRISTGAFVADVSCGRDASGAVKYYSTPTFGEENSQGSDGIASRPVFKTAPGIYDAPIQVELGASDGETIYYTLDCTTPTSASTPYTAPLAVSKNTVIRAVAYRDNYIEGYTNTGTFLFTTDEADHTLPVMTLVTDPDNLWDEDTGIYSDGDIPDDEQWPYPSANYFQKGDQWERMASFEVFGDDGSLAFQQNVAARIAGAYGRGREQKGFNIMARGEYGASRMDHAFFDNREYTSYKSLCLRAGAQDQTMSKIRDELATGLLEGTSVNFLHQAYKPYVLYLNGEYWGVYFMKEKRNRFFVAQHENTENTDDMDIIKASTRVTHGTNEEWKELMNYVNSHDLSNADNYEYVCSQVDVSSFMDYMICEIYVGNSDYANIQFYRLPGGKWKWIYYDFCWGWHNVDHQTVTQRRRSDVAGSDLFNALLKNPKWKDAFVKRFAELMDEVYDPDRVIAKIDELAAIVDPEIERERTKFNGPDADPMNQSSYDTFKRYIDRMKTFATDRPAKIKANLQSELGLSDSYMREVFGE